MTCLIYDGTFEGFISAVFDVYKMRISEVRIVKYNNETSMLFTQNIEVIFEETKFNRVKNKLVEYLGNSGFQSLWKVTLSELPEVEDILLGVIRYAFLKKQNILGDFGNGYVLQLQEILKKIGREKHRMDAFIRFKLANDGIYYATVEPDFDVIPLVCNHFKNRYADQQWVIYDIKRNYGFYYNLTTVQRVEIQEGANKSNKLLLEIGWHENEQDFQKLWKNYFNSTTIKSRKNKKLHLQYVPKRYWKYLIEKK